MEEKNGLFNCSEGDIEALRGYSNEEVERNIGLYKEIEEELLTIMREDNKRVLEMLSYGTTRVNVVIKGVVRWIFRYDIGINRIDGVVYINKQEDKVMEYITCDGGLVVKVNKYKGRD